MIRRVVDTSVAVSWYLPEKFSAAARHWQRRMLEGSAELLVPSLHYWEFANVLRTRVRRGDLDASSATDVYSLHLDAPLVAIEPDRASVLDLALKYEATAYDAVYLALCIAHDIPFLTGERPTTSWIRKLGRLADCISESPRAQAE
jgi:predicted nucleic acid-binding protein